MYGVVIVITIKVMTTPYITKTTSQKLITHRSQRQKHNKKEQNFKDENLNRYLPIGDCHTKDSRHHSGRYTLVTNLDKVQTRSPNIIPPGEVTQVRLNN
jgi:hypothetical protein